MTKALFASVLAALALASAASAGRGLFVGVDDDWLKWSSSPDRIVQSYLDLRLGAVRVTLQWQPGRFSLDSMSRLYLRRVTAAVPPTMRVVLSVYGPARAAPRTLSGRQAYCSFVDDALLHAPAISDVVIWNEANSSRFWSPQRGAAAAYESLLADCWDELHGGRKDVNVISSTAPHEAPEAFIAELGRAYRESGRSKRIFDTFGHNAYPDHSTESPLTRHRPGGSIDEGDYRTLMSVLSRAFVGTAQPVPGSRNVTIWYLEDGFETAVPAAKRTLYSGREVASSLLRSAAPPGGPERSGMDQAAQLRTALELAYCQPNVGAFFNFELVDDRWLGGWQSGVLWADRTRKPSYDPFKAAVGSIVYQQVDCSRFPASVR